MPFLRYASVLILLTCCVQAYGQFPIRPRTPTLSVGGQIAVPTGEFSEYYESYPIGINASALFPVWGLPIEGGIGFSWKEMAGEGREVYISDAFGNVHPADLKIKGNVYTYSFHGRLRPLNGKFRPYGEVMAGLASFGVKSKLYSDIEGGAPQTEVTNRDYTWITGWALGLQVRLMPGVFLEGRFEKTQGDRTEYINPRTISISPNGAYSFENQTSRIDQFALSLGLAFSF